MREFATPQLYEVPPAGNLTDLIFDNARQRPDHVSFSRKRGLGWTPVTAAQFLDEVKATARGLISAGVRPGDRVGLLSRTRYEWTVADFAIWCAGAITVPIYETSSAEQVAWILSDSQAVACFVETAAHADLIESVRAEAPSLSEVWVFEAGGVDALAQRGKDAGDDEIEARRSALRPEDPATVIYTSGTTGRPKGCILTHGNFLAELGNAVALLHELFSEDGATLLFLPLAHVFARVIQVGAIMGGSRLGHCPDIRTLVEDLGSFKPTFILAVPRVFEKVFNSATQRAHSESSLKGRIFDAATQTAVNYSQAQQVGRAGIGLRVQHGIYDRLVYSKLRAGLGGHVRYAISGGAPLGARLGHFFRGCGLTVLEGYGLTETTAASTVNPADAPRIGTVGLPLPGTQVRIADDGEIQVRGQHVFAGYWKSPEATEDVMTDGWFRTGDLGSMDEQGYLSITGRKKEIIVTAGGKNVAPAVLEDRLRAHPLVSQCMVVGDHKPYIAALVTIDPEFLPAWRAEHGVPDTAEVADLVENPALRATVQAAIDDANKAVSKAEAIKRFRILPVDFNEADGTLTPSLKVKRGVVAEKFAADIQALYS